MYSGSPAHRPRACGCRIRGSSPIAVVAEAPRVAVPGAGSGGCCIGGAWQSAGIPVTFIGRPSIARDVHEHGLTVSDYTGWCERLEEVEFSCVPAPLADADIILVTVKSGATNE